MKVFFELQRFVATIQGTSGDDRLRGSGGSDVFVYTGGNDTITNYGFNENDSIKFVDVEITDCAMVYNHRFAYNLVITTSKGSLTIENYWDKKISIIDDDENDSDSGKNISNLIPGRFINGTNYADTISNKNYYVTIQSGAGNDSIYNSMEKVYLPGASGNDYIDSGRGNDTISNKTSRVTIKAASGNDKIYSSGENVAILGGTGNDHISNSRGSFVTISGGAGDDYISSEKGVFVTISGGMGNDTIFFKDDLDYGSRYYSLYEKKVSLNGGKGNDKILNYGYYGSNVTITGGLGNDYIFLNSFARRNVIQYSKCDGNDTIVGFNSDDVLHITKGKFKTSVSGNNVIVTVGTGKITLKDAKGQQISIKNSSGKVTTKTYSNNIAELFAENNFATADNISDIVENNLTATDYKIETKNFENLTENSFVTFAK